MPRIQPIERDQTNGKAKILLDGVQKTFGMTPNLMRTLAHSPAALEAYLAFGKALGWPNDASTSRCECRQD